MVENITKKDLICPITLEEFKHPLVLDCGHTIDKSAFDSIQQQDKCPVCMQPNLSKNRINWSIVTALGLNIHVDKTSKMLTAKEAMTIANKVIDNKVTKIIETQSIPAILKKAQAGYKNITLYNNDSDESLAIRSKLEELGYKTAILKDNGFLVSWS